MTPWFIATETFTPEKGEPWEKYVAWSGLTQLREVVSLDPMLCPPVLDGIRDDDWPHIVCEDFLLGYFIDYPYFMRRIRGIAPKNVLCVFLNPPCQPVPSPASAWEFMGYDLVDVMGSASALTNCGGFPDVFSNAELSPVGLLSSHERATQAQARLRAAYPAEAHADCHVWAVFRAVGA